MDDLTIPAVATVSLTFGNLLIFNNEVLHHLSIFGGIFSLVGTLIILLDGNFKGDNGEALNGFQIILILFKSVVLGAISVLLYFLIFKYIGGVALYESTNVLLKTEEVDMISLTMATLLSWFTTPIFKNVGRRLDNV